MEKNVPGRSSWSEQRPWVKGPGSFQAWKHGARGVGGTGPDHMQLWGSCSGMVFYPGNSEKGWWDLIKTTLVPPWGEVGRIGGGKVWPVWIEQWGWSRGEGPGVGDNNGEERSDWIPEGYRRWDPVCGLFALWQGHHDCYNVHIIARSLID